MTPGNVHKTDTGLLDWARAARAYRPYMDVPSSRRLDSVWNRLSNTHSLRLCDRLGITLAINHSREGHLVLNQEWLIGPIFANARFADALRVLENLEDESAVPPANA